MNEQKIQSSGRRVAELDNQPQHIEVTRVKWILPIANWSVIYCDLTWNTQYKFWRPNMVI